MSRAIELLARMHEVKNINADERGLQSITGDVILAVFGRVQHNDPVGMDLLMAKYVNDAQSAKRLINVMSEWVNDEQVKRKDIALVLGCIALDVFCEKPVISQRRKLMALWRKYSEQAKRSGRLVKRWQMKIKQLKKELDYCESESAVNRINKSIEACDMLICKEKERLNKYAECQSLKSNICPKCRGTGRVTSALCSPCNGNGMFKATSDNIRQHLRQIGVVRVSDKLWNIELKPWFEFCLNRLYLLSKEAANVLAKELEREKSY